MVLQCEVLGMQSLLFLHLSAEVHGLSISYHIPMSSEEDAIGSVTAVTVTLYLLATVVLLGNSATVQLPGDTVSAVLALQKE